MPTMGTKTWMRVINHRLELFLHLKCERVCVSVYVCVCISSLVLPPEAIFPARFFCPIMICIHCVYGRYRNHYYVLSIHIEFAQHQMMLGDIMSYTLPFTLWTTTYVLIHSTAYSECCSFVRILLYRYMTVSRLRYSYENLMSFSKLQLDFF